MDRLDVRRCRVIVLGSLCSDALLNGCVRHTPLAITSRYPFPVAVYDTTNSNYAPKPLGIVAPGAVLETDLTDSSEVYRLTVHRGHGKIIKQITVSEQAIINTDMLVIGR